MPLKRFGMLTVSVATFLSVAAYAYVHAKRRNDMNPNENLSSALLLH